MPHTNDPTLKLNGELVRSYLQRKEITHKTLAGMLGVSPRTVAYILEGKCPKHKTVIRLAQIMRINPNHLVSVVMK